LWIKPVFWVYFIDPAGFFMVVRGYSFSSTGLPTLRGERKPSLTCGYSSSPQEEALVITNTYIKEI
jgi:hypothetical protein